jgi:hypothetical protein
MLKPYRVLGVRHEGKIPVKKTYHSVEDNIKMETKVIENGCIDMSHLSESIN